MITLCIRSDSVAVLFDDGVEYTAPLRSVRKRVSEVFSSTTCTMYFHACANVYNYLLCKF